MRHQPDRRTQAEHERPDTDVGGGNYGAGKVWGEETPLRTDAHGRPLEGPNARPRAPEPAVRTDITGRRRRTGSEPRTARSDLDLRVFLSSVFAPLFLIGTGVFAYLAARAGAHASPPQGLWIGLAAACAVLTLAAAADIVLVQRRRRRS